MRHSFRQFAGLLAFVFVSVAVLTGCSDDPTGNDNNNGHGTMSAKVNGQAWSAGNVTQAHHANGVIGIGGAQIEGSNNMQITIIGPVSGVGEHAIGGFTGLQGNFSTGSSTTDIRTFAATSGTLKIEELTETGAKGTFSFEAKEQILGGGQGTETRSITDGTFDVTFF